MPVSNRPVTWADLRRAVVWQGLNEVLSTPPFATAGGATAGGLTVVDAGGGSGGFAVPLAEQGHHVTVVDPSPDSLASLERRAAERGVADLVRAQQGDLSTLLDVVGAGKADVVLCHNVLEVVDDPQEALSAATAALRPGGLLSVLAASRAAAVLGRALAGRFTEAAIGLGDPSGRCGPHDTVVHRFDADSLAVLVAGTGAEVFATHGVRIFADLVPGSLINTDPNAARALLDLELLASRQRPYLDIATHLHVLALRRGG